MVIVDLDERLRLVIGRSASSAEGAVLGKPFGLVYVDYPTLERIPKSSFYWYRDLIKRSSTSVGEATRA